MVRPDRHRQRARLRAVWQKLASCGSRELPQRRALDPAPQFAVELLLQPHRPLRSASEAMQGHLLRRLTRRFPELNFAFLEAARAEPARSTPISSATGEAQPRGPREHEPARLDRAALLALAEKYGSRRWWSGPSREGLDDNATARRRRGPRRLLALQDHPQGRLPRPLRQALLLRLRADDPSTRGPSTQGQPDARAAQRVLQLRYRHMDVPT